MNYKAKIADALSGLKDFQVKTVDYVFDQLYNQNRHKMLVADEVGLGKTIVAKGVIAKGFERYLEQGGPTKLNPTYNVVYICSNLSLANQNIRKLNFLGSKEYEDDIISRLTYLALQPDEKPKPFLINSLTPGTSFDIRNRGERKERAIIYQLLMAYSFFENRKNGLKWLLKGGITNVEGWEKTLKEELKIRKDLYLKYKDVLTEINFTKEKFPKLFTYLNTEAKLSFWHALGRACDKIDGRNAHNINFASEVISFLRRVLSKICIDCYMGADIYILDEFQKYSELIKLDQFADNPAIELARTIFQNEEAKILMLSATPFKPFTSDFDELNGEVHYKEFESVLKFLHSNGSQEEWEKFKTNRRKFFLYLRHASKLSENYDLALKVKQELETLYRQSIVRTERLMASKDKSPIINSVLKNKSIDIREEDISDFVLLDKITEYLNKNHETRLCIPLEYVKSSPYALSYLDNYQHKKKLISALKEKNSEELLDFVKKTKNAWIDFKKINEYQPIVPSDGSALPNGKLRLLLSETVENNGWKYLWIPPSLEYYEAFGAYKNSKGYSKSIIFSSWMLVPKMISTLVSYEAERCCVGNPDSISEAEKIEEKRSYFTKRRSPRPQLTYKVEKGDNEPKQMNGFIYLFPSLYLASVYNPAGNLKENLSIEEIRQKVSEIIRPELLKITSKYKNGKIQDWQKWFWAAPLLIEREKRNNYLYKEWFGNEIPTAFGVDSENELPEEAETSGKGKHFSFAAEIYKNPSSLELPELDENDFNTVLHFLVDLCLASPAVCFLRSLLKYGTPELKILTSSYYVAQSFVTLFNKPESIAIVRLNSSGATYIDSVLDYSISGNIQSMIDEYVYLLRTCENFEDSSEIAECFSDVASIRTSSISVDNYDDFISKCNGKEIKDRKLRSHFAVEFGNQKISTASGIGRQINLRQAFNSPFRPFVLASTSIGQEGLDFHYYCKKIFHWNLPSNPIDLEQREGRINRYQGLVIRQNVVHKYFECLKYYTNDQVWENLFESAIQEKNAEGTCDLIPHWHFDTEEENLKIERFVPLYSFSKDIEKYKNILKVLTLYRLTFGQPRQDELIEALYEGTLDNIDKQKLNELVINLSPMEFYNCESE